MAETVENALSAASEFLTFATAPKAHVVLVVLC